jgi:hypothetical protein
MSLEKRRVTSTSSGNVDNDASVSFQDTQSVNASDDPRANTVLTALSTLKPRSMRTCVRSLVARLMISPAGILR